MKKRLDKRWKKKYIEQGRCMARIIPFLNDNEQLYVRILFIIIF